MSNATVLRGSQCGLIGAIVTASLLGGCHLTSSTYQPASSTAAPSPADTAWVGQGRQRLHVQAYRHAHLSAHPVLVVVVHGDAPFRPPDYQYLFAQQVAAQYPDVVAVGLLRPGYTDPQGHRSAGIRGETTGDNYTPEVVGAVAGALTQLRQRYRARRVVVVGHSGGAAITADVLARYPASVAAALLVSCPCDVPRWRRHMQQRQGGAIWDAPVRSLSPQALVAGVALTTPVTVVVGTADSLAPLRLSQAYWQALHQRHHPAKLVLLAGQEHDILLTPAVRREVGVLLQAPESE